MTQINWSERIRAALLAVARRRCPACGQAKAFASWWKMHPACSSCGRQFQHQSGSATGTMQVGSMAVVFFGLVAWLVIHVITDWSRDAELITTSVACVLFGLCPTRPRARRHSCRAKPDLPFGHVSACKIDAASLTCIEIFDLPRSASGWKPRLLGPRIA